MCVNPDSGILSPPETCTHSPPALHGNLHERIMSCNLACIPVSPACSYSYVYVYVCVDIFIFEYVFLNGIYLYIDYTDRGGRNGMSQVGQPGCLQVDP